MKDKASLAHRSELNCKHPQSYWKITIRSLKEVGFAICPVWLWQLRTWLFTFSFSLSVYFTLQRAALTPCYTEPLMFRHIPLHAWLIWTRSLIAGVFAKRPGKALRTQGWQTTLAGFLPCSLRYIQPILHSGQPEEEMTQLGTYGHGSFKEIFPVFSYHCVHVWII